MSENCSLCGCKVHRNGGYAKPDIKGRSHATEHHYVAERFYGRSANRPGTLRKRIFPEDSYGIEGQTGVFCYECHEEILHNPIFLPEDIEKMAEIIRLNDLDEDDKDESREKLAGRIRLLREIIVRGLDVVFEEARRNKSV